MIQIEEKHYIGRGISQYCYIHPDNDNICLKIRRKRKKNPNDPRIDREIRYYKKIQKKTNLPFIAKYHGQKITNLGSASSFDLIKDETTNTVSLPLSDYLKMDNSPFSDDLFISELEKLKRKLIKHKIIVRDLKANNICCKVLKDNSIELIVIDGVGHRDFFPLVEWFSVFTKRKMDKIFFTRKLYSMDEHRSWLRAKKLI